ncbi:MAG: phosphopantothenoylcysteine decarboxylase [Planctomycetota bacterium]|nr:MAG: phosphopantothenoylcysteine decarboxylase [Planctomycetota bacterium]REJ93969.1 MAG: phosphopantothenoylcysteine decarboxylase [Planctomycetota bacterium]
MQGRELLLGVAGGVAAFKAAALTSQLVQSGARVTVVMTAAAQHFIGRATFEALTGRPVHRDVFDPVDCPLGAHIELAERAELMCVAPATANFMAKAAGGLADDLLSTLYLTNPGPLLLAPAMNSDMWEKPAVQRNLAQLREDGAIIVDPESGWLSCRKTGTGRMASPETIHAAIAAEFAKLG